MARPPLTSALLLALLALAAACAPRRTARPQGQPPGWTQPPPSWGHPQGYPPPAPPTQPGHAPPPAPPGYASPGYAPPPPTHPPAPSAQQQPDPWGWLQGMLGSGPPSGPASAPPTLPPFALPPMPAGLPGLGGWWPVPPQPAPPAAPPGAAPVAPGAIPPIGARARELAAVINRYRVQNGLHAVPLSPALTHVAETHVRDLRDSPPRPGCNGHSWTDRGPWTACCYTPDHAQAQCMWQKPREVASYDVTGFEISIGNPGESTGFVLDGEGSLRIWQSSPAHHDVILSRGTWASRPWRAMGAGIIDSHAAIWWSDQVDPLAQ